jgi:methylase of polypeptide subunit release factors
MSTSSYVIPFKVLLKQIGLLDDFGNKPIELTLDQLLSLVRVLLASVPVDETWYQTAYPDVAQAIQSGAVKSAKAHFVSHGYFEGRLPAKVPTDKAFYASQYPEAMLAHLMLKPLVWPRLSVAVQVDDALLEKMICRVAESFSHLGRTDPHWSIVRSEKFRVASIASHEAEFFASGADYVEDLQVTVSRYDIDLASFADCFELGSGLGRNTIWLAQKFPKVIGSDVSAIHLDFARQTLAKRRVNNVQFLHIADLSALHDLPDFDVFFAIIVLQHNPPPLIAYILKAVLAKIRPGGIGYFQVPTYAQNYSFDATAYLESPLKLDMPELHIMPQDALFDLIDQAGCRIVEVREDGGGGPNTISSRLLIQKRQ